MPASPEWSRPAIDLSKQEVKEWAEGRGAEDEPKPEFSPEPERPLTENEAQASLEADPDYQQAVAQEEQFAREMNQLMHTAEMNSVYSYDAAGHASTTLNSELARALSKIVVEKNIDESDAAEVYAARLVSAARDGYDAVLSRTTDRTVRAIVQDKRSAILDQYATLADAVDRGKKMAS